VHYSGLSKDEVYLISRAEYEGQKLITGAFAQGLFSDAKKAANILDRLTRKGRLLQLARGKYMMVPIKAPGQLWLPNEYIIAKYWMGDTPYYIGYFTMYHYWGFTEQVPQTIFVLNTRKSGIKTVSAIRFKAVKINAGKYFGVKRAKMGDEMICVSDRERTLVDFIYHPIGSLKNVRRVLRENLKKINGRKFIDYLIKFPVISTRKRAGYLLEGLNFPSRELNRLRKSLSGDITCVVLDRTKPARQGKINKDWQIIVNG
jgi:predicted transcriptional regulator of viral defense system